jgi:hypothetical protein
VIRPNAQIASMARHPLDLFDQCKARDVYPLAYAQTERLLGTWLQLDGILAPPRAVALSGA